MKTEINAHGAKKIKIDVNGMHCKSCELLLEKSLKKGKNITNVHASEKSGTVEISYEGNDIEMSEIKLIIEESGYKLGKKQTLTWFNKDKSVYSDFIIVLISLLAIYLILSSLGIDVSNFGNFSKPTFGVALIIGLTAGISSCMALVGGLVLGVSAKWSEDHNNYSKFAKFEPHLFFNLGRIIGFAFLGGILGLFGQIFSLSPFMIGVLMLITGLVMLFLGINLSEISPKLSSLSLTLPKSFGKNVGKDNGGSKHIFALTTGALTFFLPCGFTLAMQAYAITTGNFVDGALIMMAFAIGTAPGLLGVGGLSSLFSGEKSKKIFKTMGVLVILLSLVNIANGYTLISLGRGTSGIKNQTEANPGEIQEIKMTQSSAGYSPSEFHIKPNTKTRWIITVTNPYSCSTQLMVPSLGITKNLEKGENIIEFISPSSGEIKFSCSMGMYTGKIIIDSPTSSNQNLGYNQASAETSQNNSVGGKCSVSGGAGGCSGTKKSSQNTGGCGMMGGGNAKTASTTVDSNSSDNNAELINITYTSAGMNPGEINVKKGKSYKLVIDVKDTIEGCMSTITIPGLDENRYNLTAGTKIVFNIKTTESGKFPLTCAMGVPHGYINVE